MKKFLTILPLLITAVVLATGIIWLGFSFQEDQKQTFHVIESGRTEVPLEADTCAPSESVCMASTTPLGTTQ